MNGKDFAIGLLSVTAVILLVGLVLLTTLTPTPAFAFAQTASRGKYVATTVQYHEEMELIFVIDTASEIMNVYRFNHDGGFIELSQQLDIRVPEPKRDKAQQPGARQR